MLGVRPCVVFNLSHMPGLCIQSTKPYLIMKYFINNQKNTTTIDDGNLDITTSNFNGTSGHYSVLFYI